MYHPLRNSITPRHDGDDDKEDEDLLVLDTQPHVYTVLQKLEVSAWFNKTRSTILIFGGVMSFAALIALAVRSVLWNHEPQLCTSPQVRREWRQLKNIEKQEYINAVKCLQTIPSQLSGIGRRSDDFAWVHRYQAKSIHDTAKFLPYHRYLIHLYEKDLRELCHYSGVLTYWDWGLDWEDPTKSAIWDPKTGFGGDGDPDGKVTVGWGSCVRNGPFADYKVLFYNMVPKLHCLSRGFGRCFDRKWTGEAFKPAAIQYVKDQATFANFSSALEDGPHNDVPNNVCGDFYYLEAPNDPVFFLHHANLDRLWHEWQNKESGRIWEYNGGLNSTGTHQSVSLDDVLLMKGLGPDITIREVMNTQAGGLCYTYE